MDFVVQIIEAVICIIHNLVVDIYDNVGIGIIEFFISHINYEK
jgi:hypothetical protein